MHRANDKHHANNHYANNHPNNNNHRNNNNDNNRRNNSSRLSVTLCSFAAASNTTSLVNLAACQPWCNGNSAPWMYKCTWLMLCDGCAPCFGQF